MPICEQVDDRQLEGTELDPEPWVMNEEDPWIMNDAIVPDPVRKMGFVLGVRSKDFVTELSSFCRLCKWVVVDWLSQLRSQRQWKQVSIWVRDSHSPLWSQ